MQGRCPALFFSPPKNVLRDWAGARPTLDFMKTNVLTSDGDRTPAEQFCWKRQWIDAYASLGPPTQLFKKKKATDSQFAHVLYGLQNYISRSALCLGRLRLKCDGTCAETRFRLSAKWKSPFQSAGASVQSTTGSRVVSISDSNTWMHNVPR